MSCLQIKLFPCLLDARETSAAACAWWCLSCVWRTWGHSRIGDSNSSAKNTCFCETWTTNYEKQRTCMCTIMHKFFLEDHRLSFHAFGCSENLCYSLGGCSIIFDKGSGSGVCGSIDASLQCPESCTSDVYCIDFCNGFTMMWPSQLVIPLSVCIAIDWDAGDSERIMRLVILVNNRCFDRLGSMNLRKCCATSKTNMHPANLMSSWHA